MVHKYMYMKENIYYNVNNRHKKDLNNYDANDR